MTPHDSVYTCRFDFRLSNRHINILEGLPVCDWCCCHSGENSTCSFRICKIVTYVASWAWLGSHIVRRHLSCLTSFSTQQARISGIVSFAEAAFLSPSFFFRNSLRVRTRIGGVGNDWPSEFWAKIEIWYIVEGLRPSIVNDVWLEGSLMEWPRLTPDVSSSEPFLSSG